MPPDLPFERVTVADAAKRLGKASGTIYSWGTRYHARRLTVRGVAYYDMRDLRVIEREIRHGHPVPTTPEERAAIRLRCPLRAAELEACRDSAA
jgi:hypothetical protein